MADENGRDQFSVSDALMPLMDVSILLLGLLMIIIAVGMAQRGESKATDAALPADVDLLTVHADGTVSMRGQPVPLELLPRQLRSIDKAPEDRLVLILVADPWSNESDKAYKQVVKTIRDEQVRYCLFSP